MIGFVGEEEGFDLVRGGALPRERRTAGWRTKKRAVRRRPRVLAIFLLGGLFGGLMSGCQPAAKPDAAKSGSSAEWDRYVESYLEAYFAAHPEFAVSLGRHDFDGHIEDFSRTTIDGEIARLHAQRTQAATFTGLDARRSFEREYLLAAIDSDLFWMETAGWPYHSPGYYAGAIDPQVYLTRPYASLEQRMRAFVAHERGIPTVLEQMKANLRTPMPRTYGLCPWHVWRSGAVS
jgi:hypothetical protein